MRKGVSVPLNVYLNCLHPGFKLKLSPSDFCFFERCGKTILRVNKGHKIQAPALCTLVLYYIEEKGFLMMLLNFLSAFDPLSVLL